MESQRVKGKTIVDSLELITNGNRYKFFTTSNDSIALSINNKPIGRFPYSLGGVTITSQENGIGLSANTNFGLQFSLTKASSDFSPKSQLKLARNYDNYVVGICAN